MVHLISMLLISACMTGCLPQPGKTTMADLVQAIAAHTKSRDWEALKSLSLNPERGSGLHRSRCLQPAMGGLRSWTFRKSAEVPKAWSRYIPFENLDACDKVIKMSWSVPIEFGVGNMDVYYPVAQVEGLYYIRFLRIKRDED